MNTRKLAAFVAAILFVLLAAFPAAAQDMPRIPRPAPVLPYMQTGDFVEAFLEWRNADTSECHSQPFEFAEALFDLKGVFKNEYGNGATAKIVRNPGPVGAGIMVADFTSGKMPKLMSTGEALYRDKQDKLVWLWTHEDVGIFTVHDSIEMPAGAEWIMFPLQGDVLDHAVDFAEFWGNNEEDCADGAARTLERQGYVPAAETVVPADGQPMTVAEFEAAVAGLTGAEWLAAANAAAEAADGAYRIDVVGQYTLEAGFCLVYWGTPVELVGGIDMAAAPADAGWAGIIVCAEGADVVLTFPVEHSGVLLAAE